jgi:hypothetical protein
MYCALKDGRKMIVESADATAQTMKVFPEEELLSDGRNYTTVSYDDVARIDSDKVAAYFMIDAINWLLGSATTSVSPCTISQEEKQRVENRLKGLNAQATHDLSVEQIAEKYGVSKKEIRRQRAAGTLEQFISQKGKS